MAPCITKCRRIPILGKHKKRIICGAWSVEGFLALASEDKVLTISTSEGDTRREIILQGDPSHIQFSEMKMDHRLGGENTVLPSINTHLLVKKFSYEYIFFLMYLKMFRYPLLLAKQRYFCTIFWIQKIQLN